MLPGMKNGVKILQCIVNNLYKINFEEIYECKLKHKATVEESYVNKKLM